MVSLWMISCTSLRCSLYKQVLGLFHKVSGLFLGGIFCLHHGDVPEDAYRGKEKPWRNHAGHECLVWQGCTLSPSMSTDPEAGATEVGELCGGGLSGRGSACAAVSAEKTPLWYASTNSEIGFDYCVSNEVVRASYGSTSGEHAPGRWVNSILIDSFVRRWSFLVKQHTTVALPHGGTMWRPLKRGWLHYRRPHLKPWFVWLES